MLSKNKLLFINNKVYSKANNILPNDIAGYLKYRNSLDMHIRTEYKFCCENCGKEYSIKLNIADYNKRKNSHHYCYECTKSGVIFRGIPKSDVQKEKMRQSYLERKIK